MSSKRTPSHFQIVTINVRLREWVPEHEPRETDPHYALFRAAKRKMRELDLPCWRCGVHYVDLVKKGEAPTAKNLLGAYQLEAHHNELEFSLLNAVDAAKWWDSSHRADAGFMVESFSRVDGWLERHPEYQGKPHDEVFDAYMESEGNLMQLCLTPESPVLMEDGKNRPIGTLRVGDRVLGPDGRSHPVTGVGARFHRGDIVVIDGHQMTANHPVLTPAGWLPAGRVREGQVLAHLMEVAVAQMLGLRAIEAQVLDAVVRPITVDVMDPLCGLELASEVLLHDPAVLHHADALSVAPHASPHIARGMQPGVHKDALGAVTGEGVEPREPALVGAESVIRTPGVLEGRSTLAASSGGRVDAHVGFSPRRGAPATARRVARGDLRGDHELAAAHAADAEDAGLARDARWRAVREVHREPYRGFVHDITIADCPAFVTGDMVVHNCDVCHRSKEEGIHHIPYPDWRARAVWRTDLPQHIQAAP